MKTTVIYHRADFDGLFSAAVCKKFLPDDTEFIGWDFGYPQIKQPDGTTYVVDLPLSCMERNGDRWPDIVWIDHHKSSIDQWGGMTPGYQIDGVAACRLCWQWFLDPVGAVALAKTAWTDRMVPEPLALTLAGEYDVWDKRDDRADPFQFGLYARGYGVDECLHLLNALESKRLTLDVVDAGRAAMNWQQAFASQVCEGRSYVRNWEGRTFCVLASCHARNSMWFPQEAIPDECDALMCWRYDGERVSFSLYHAPGHEEHDLSTIAVKYGGGGHRGACGFSMNIDEALEIIR